MGMLSNNITKYIINCCVGLIRRSPFRFILQILVVALSVSLVVSIRIATRESLSSFDSLGSLTTKPWKVEFHHASGIIPKTFLKFLPTSNIRKFILYSESYDYDKNHNSVTVLSIIGSTADINLNIKSFDSCRIKPSINYDCANPIISSDQTYDIIKFDGSKNPSSLAVYDDISQSDILQIERSFPGLYIETNLDKSTRANTLTSAYRTNIEFLLLLCIFLTAFVIFASSYHDFSSLKGIITTFRTLGFKKSEIFLFIIIRCLFTSLIGAVVGLVIFYPFTKFLAKLYFLSTQAHFQSSLAVPQFKINLITDLILALTVALLSVFLGNLIPLFKILNIQPSLSPIMSEESFIKNDKLIRFGILLLFITLFILVILVFIPNLNFAYLAAIMVFLSAGVISWLLLKPIISITQNLSIFKNPSNSFALSSVKYDPIRFGLSSFAFGCSIAFLISMNCFIQSFRVSLTDWMDATFHADIYLRQHDLPISEDLVSYIKSSKDVDWFIQTKESDIPFKDGRIKLIIVPLSTIVEKNLYKIEDSLKLFNSDNAIFISQITKNKFHLKLNDKIQLLGKEFVVSGIFQDFANERGAFLIDDLTYKSIIGDVTSKTVSIKLKPNISYSEFLLKLLNLSIPNLESFSTLTLKDEALRIFDNTFKITWIIQGLVFVVCLVNFLLSFIQDIESRQRIYGTLRLLGFSRFQFRIVISTLASIILISSIIGGGVSGVILGYIIVCYINTLSFGWSIPFILTISSFILPCLFGLISIFIALPILEVPIFNAIEKAKVTFE